MNGFVTSRIYKFFNGTNWITCAWATALFLPVIIGLSLLFIDYIEFIERAATYLPISSITLIFIIWGCVNLPLVLLGSWYGFKFSPIEVPVKVSRIPRETPTNLPFYTWKSVTVTAGGFACFACASSEVYFLITSIWREQYYFMYFFLGIALIMTFVSAALVSILQTYALLNNGNFHWWWRSFWIGAATGAYLWLACWLTYSFKHSEDNDGLNVFIYHICSLNICLCIALMCGMVSFYASFRFVRKIYSEAKDE